MSHPAREYITIEDSDDEPQRVIFDVDESDEEPARGKRKRVPPKQWKELDSPKKTQKKQQQEQERTMTAFKLAVNANLYPAATRPGIADMENYENDETTIESGDIGQALEHLMTNSEHRVVAVTEPLSSNSIVPRLDASGQVIPGPWRKSTKKDEVAKMTNYFDYLKTPVQSNIRTVPAAWQDATQIVVVPIHDLSAHWSCFLVDLASNTLEYFDSYGSNFSLNRWKVVKDGLLEYFRTHHGIELTFVTNNTVIQGKSQHCGAYMLGFVLLRASGLPNAEAVSSLPNDDGCVQLRHYIWNIDENQQHGGALTVPETQWLVAGKVAVAATVFYWFLRALRR